MWRRLLSGPWPDNKSIIPDAVQQQAAQRIRHYWLTRGWQFILGEFVLLGGVVYYQELDFLSAYATLTGLITLAWLLGLQSRYPMLWLFGHLALFVLRGLLINGLGAVTALSVLVPYIIAGMILPERQRFLIQSGCIAAFWLNLIYEAFPFFRQLAPPLNITISYNILLAAFIFQLIRFLNQLAVEINTAYVAEEIQQRSQRFLARVSHELRTPLNSVLGFAKLLRRADLSETHQRYLHQIIEESEQLNHLVSDLLDSAHLSTGKLTLNPEPCDINALCATVAEEHRPNLSDSVELCVDLAPDLPLIQADPMRLRQAVGNLVSNAVKYTEQGTVTLQTTQSGKTLCVLVRDTGVGIPEAEQNLIFVPFVQLDNRRIGVGLGLDIARQLVRLHGGDIHLESTPGQGSTFIIELPTIN